MSFSGFREQSHDSDARLWHPARGMPDEGIASGAEPARQRSTMHPRSLILGLAGWINRQQHDVIAYIQEENRILKQAQGQTDSLHRR